MRGGRRSIDCGHADPDHPLRPPTCPRFAPPSRPREPAYLADLERLVNIDCGSYTKAGVDEVGAWTADRLRSLGATVRAEPNDLGLGETVIADIPGTDPDGVTLLCIGHMDTVFDPGTAAERPVRHQRTASRPAPASPT